MRQEGDKLIMKGKKYGNTMILTRMESSPKEELERILETQQLMAGTPYDRVEIAGKEYPLDLDYDNRQFIAEISDTGKAASSFSFH